MIAAKWFIGLLRELGVTFFSGVPDSLLQEFCAAVAEPGKHNHLIAANEGGAVALAAGHYLATGAPGLVYMQNSGQGNAVNPLLSLADREVYGIPMLLLVGWRGEPGVADEPQHIKQGRVTESVFAALELPCEVMASSQEGVREQLVRLLTLARNEERPVALLVRKGSFASGTKNWVVQSDYRLVREEVIAEVVSTLPAETIYVASTGHIARELYEYRMRSGGGLAADFLTVGSMGHASQIALALARSRPERLVCCLDGDGAALMHLGGWALIGESGCSNYRHVVLNNGMHGSVGGQATVGFAIDLALIARGCNYRSATMVSTREECTQEIRAFSDREGPSLLEVRLGPVVRSDLGRPKSTPRENRAQLMKLTGSRSGG